MKLGNAGGAKAPCSDAKVQSGKSPEIGASLSTPLDSVRTLPSWRATSAGSSAPKPRRCAPSIDGFSSRRAPRTRPSCRPIDQLRGQQEATQGDDKKPKRKPRREPLPDHLRRVEHRHDPANTT
jgi:hypothetical protein